MKNKWVILSLLVAAGTAFGLLHTTPRANAGHPDTLRWDIQKVLKTEKVMTVTSVEHTGINGSSAVIVYREQDGSVKTEALEEIQKPLYQPLWPVQVFVNEKRDRGGLEVLVGMPLKSLRIERQTSYLLFGGARGQVYSDAWVVYVVKAEGNQQGNNQGQNQNNTAAAKTEGFIQTISLENAAVVIGKEGNSTQLTVTGGTLVTLNGTSVTLSELQVGDKVGKAIYNPDTGELLQLEVNREN